MTTLSDVSRNTYDDPVMPCSSVSTVTSECTASMRSRSGEIQQVVEPGYRRYNLPKGLCTRLPDAI
jgi:hypothetical protein